MLRDERDGSARAVPCELVVFTGDWIPDHELARLAGAKLDPGTRGPAVDTTLRTSVPGLFAAGNLVQAAETADVAALSGRHAAAHVAAYLAAQWPSAGETATAGQAGGRHVPVPVMVAEPLLWISPNAVSPATRGHPADSSCCAPACSPAAPGWRCARTGACSSPGARAWYPDGAFGWTASGPASRPGRRAGAGDCVVDGGVRPARAGPSRFPARHQKDSEPNGTPAATI